MLLELNYIIFLFNYFEEVIVDLLAVSYLVLQSHASQILGFKFQYYQRMDVKSPVPFGLYKLTALLVREDFIDLDSV